MALTLASALAKLSVSNVIARHCPQAKLREANVFKGMRVQ